MGNQVLHFLEPTPYLIRVKNKLPYDYRFPDKRQQKDSKICIGAQMGTLPPIAPAYPSTYHSFAAQ